MAIHRFEAVQVLPTDMDTAWDFFSSPANLPAITPPWLGFKVTSKLPDAMYPGLFVTYKVSPIFGIALDWVTEITHISHKEFFVDEQRTGPYRIWHHEHHFRDVPGGVEMRDIVHYDVGFGFAGDLIAKRVVGPRVEAIFAYRQQVLNERFGLYVATTRANESALLQPPSGLPT